ncbi:MULTISPECIES: carboxymuconolactone decarboxylase family protein [unclassified Microbacterium]|uniref:carboxymuconolactone decarboxylase family protein n=1 Tax=unclassified Microbacterium TaxID=2609290 RepID=UPI00214CC906|nr:MULTISPECIES: carboxymuconolactone decarboxylase family protein [unclassified Microbacterium]MCR2809737.1 carboxymuconolactone decarboxylase family protein [Microbacterium sp. zg.B185]WIM17947.1 carboxymuconolactone decarboxylase family protein [Microbacterium sp. zg-B185]
MIVHPPPADSAVGTVAEMYEADLREDGFVSSVTQAMALNPEAHSAFEALIAAIVPSIGVRTYELVTLAAARGIPSPHCLLAHGRKALRADALDEDQLERVALDYESAGLDESDVAVMRFAEKISTDPASMTDDDSRVLREYGFTDRQIVDIALAAAARNYLSRALRALAVPVQEIPGLSPRLVRALLSPVPG